ncbi:hypothetical protein PTKIN_Ptkin08bG0172400 [Pterospermum kingtungense]
MKDTDHSKFTSKTPHFFKVLLEEAIRNGKLGIPRKFVRKYGNQLPSTIQLEVPSGAIWQVELTKCDKGMWLQKGWQEFAEHYSLELGYFVVFRYEGNGRFHVLIFDKSASEIEYPCTNTEEDDDEMPVGHCDDISVSRKSKEKSNLPCPRPQKKIRTDSPNRAGADLEAEILSSRFGADDPKRTNLGKLKEVEKSHCSTGQLDDKKGVEGITATRSVKTEVLSCVQRLTDAEKAHAVQRTSAFKCTGNPVFMVVMQPSFVSNRYRMIIPLNFARKFLTTQNGNLTLCDSTGKTWPAKYSRSGNTSSIYVGWRAFAEDNNLALGDICVFELIKHPEILLKVVIYPVVKNASKARRPPADRSIASRVKISRFVSDAEPNCRQSRCPGSFRECKDPKIEENEDIEVLDDFLLNQKTKKKSRAKSNLPCPRSLKKRRTNSPDQPGTDLEVEIISSRFSADNPRSGRIKQGNLKIIEKSHCSMGQVDVPSPATKGVGGITATTSVKTEVLSCTQKLAGAEKAQAVQRVSAFKCTGNPVFMVVMQPSYVSNRYRMSIPLNFARKFLTMKNGDLTLCDSSGKTWPAKYIVRPKIKKANAYMYGGWRAFAEANNLVVGDMCVFELIKHPEILLKVVIYPVVENASKAYKPLADGSVASRVKMRSWVSDTEPTCSQSRCPTSFRECKDSKIEENEKIEVLDDFLLNQKTEKKSKEKSNLPCTRSLRERRTNSTNQPGPDLEVEIISSRFGADDPKSGRIKLGNLKKVEKSPCSTGQLDATKGVRGITALRSVKTEVLSCVQKLTDNEKAQAIQRSSAFKCTGNPVFMVVMQPSSVSHAYTMGIPLNFARKFLTEKNGNLTLCDSTGKTWPARYHLSSGNERPKPYMHGGWRAFAEDNNLVVGDLCVFELIRHPEILLKVVIYPVVKNASKACRSPGE